MRNWRELTEDEVRKLEELYPTTVNRELSRMFDISIDSIQDRFAKPLGWKKDRYKVLIGNRGGHTLTDDEKKWIRKHYAHTKNAVILSRFNIGESQLHRFCREEGLGKSKQFVKKSRLENFAIATQICHEHGIYDENAERQRQRWEEMKKLPREQWVGRKPGVKPQHQPGVNARKYLRRVREGVEKRRETFRKERRRALYGLEQKTKLKVYGVMTRKMSAQKHCMIKHCNYFGIDDHPTWVCYDSQTRRSAQREKHAIELGLKIYQGEEQNVS